MPQTHKTTPKKRSIPVHFLTIYRILYAENNLHTIRAWQERVKKNGVSNCKAASIIGINKETVNNYMSKVNADELGIDDLQKLDDPIL